MVDITRLGVQNATTDGSFAQDNKLFLTKFGGEILTAFHAENKFIDKHMVRTIESGKSAQFPATGIANAKYHTPGTGTHDNAEVLKNSERTINIDGLLYANTMIYDLDEMKNHWDVRGPYAKELGEALSREFDQKIGRVLAKAARSSATVTGGNGGSVLNKGATVATDSSVLAAALFEAAQVLDEKNIGDERFCALNPAQYYLLAQDKDQINKDWGGMGSYADGNVLRIAGIELVKSNNMPKTNVAAATDGENNDYTGDFTDTVGLVWHRSAVGTLKLKDLATQMTDPNGDFNAMFQSTMLLAKYAMGHGILRPECSLEISKAV